MSLYKAEAIVLRDYDLGDQDKIVIFYTRRYGKIKVVAKGGRRIKSRFASAIQPLSYDSLVIRQSRKGDLDTLSECEIKRSFLKIRQDLIRFAYGSYLTELIIRLVEYEETYPALFYLLLRSLFLLEKTSHKNLKLLVRSFELKLWDVLGYRPCLDRCVHCGREIELVKSLYLSIKLGGILCEVCRGQDRESKALSGQAVQLMNHLLHSRLERVCQSKVDENLEEQLEIILQEYLSYRGEKKMLTPSFVHSFEKLESKER